MSKETILQPYLKFLCDPVSRQPLELERNTEGTPSLVCRASGLRYLFMDDIPDLRPEAGVPLHGEKAAEIFSKHQAEKHNEVMRHYDQKPCHNYLALDNIPLGRWLRSQEYAAWFENLDFVVEVGAGKGAIAEAFKQRRGVTPFCIDLAYGSLQYVRRPPLEAPAALGSNLRLPLRDAVADMVISYGVIHHTPDPIMSFRELARVLKPGGKLLLGVYSWEGLYRSLYFFVSPQVKAVRKILGAQLGDLVLKVTAFPLYYLALSLALAVFQKRFLPGLRRAWEQFGDDFLTPFARFYMREEMISLGEALGLRLIEHAMGGARKAHFYWFEKPA